MILLIDIGNTRIKWGAVNAGRFCFGGAAAYANGLAPSFFQKLWGDLPRPTHVWISSVASEKTHWILQKWIKQSWHCQPVFAHSQKKLLGLSNGYADFERLGVDRWLGMLEAWRQQRQGFCLISAGTALTVDWVNDTGQHLGGYIVPGLTMMQESLITQTVGCRLDPSQAPSASTVPADNTHEAITAGTNALFNAFLQTLENQIAAAMTTPSIWLTGGNAQQIQGLLQTPCVLQPHLVLLGLFTQGQASNALGIKEGIRKFSNSFV